MSALGADTAASRGKSLFLETASKPEDLPANVASGSHHRVILMKPAASFFYCGCFTMIKKASLMTALSVTAFSGWAQESNSDTLVVTANRFQQPVNTVLAPTDIVTRDDIDRWQSKDLNDVMRRLPGVDIARNGYYYIIRRIIPITALLVFDSGRQQPHMLINQKRLSCYT